MQQKATLLIFSIGTVAGLLLSLLDLTWIPIFILVFTIIALATMGTSIAQSLSKRKNSLSYGELAQQLFVDITLDIRVNRNLIDNVEKEPLRNQLNLICEDIITLLKKVSEKTPESRMSTGKFIRGNLDFILTDILPQYIEMQNTPRYYESPEEKMREGHEAIDIFAKFLQQRIIDLELADDIRYSVAIEMLKALDGYTNGNQHNHNSHVHKEGKTQ